MISPPNTNIPSREIKSRKEGKYSKKRPCDNDIKAKRRRTVSFQTCDEIVETVEPDQITLIPIQNGEEIQNSKINKNIVEDMGGNLCVATKNSSDYLASSTIGTKHDASNNATDSLLENGAELDHNTPKNQVQIRSMDKTTPATPDSVVTTPTGIENRIISRYLSSTQYDANCDPNGKYTFEEITQLLQTRFIKLLKCENFSDESMTADLRFIKRRTNYNPSNTFRLRVADKMDELGVLQLFMRVWTCIHIDNDVEKVQSLGLNNLVQVVSTIWNISDISRSLCEKISRCGILEEILEDLNSEVFKLENLVDDTRMYYIKGVFGILHNLCRHCRDSRETLRSLGAVQALQKYLNKDPQAEIIHCRVLLILCYLIDEHENNVIHADDSHITYIVTILKSAVESKGHFSRQYGFSASEILCGLNHLAANDTNKQRIVDKGALPLFVELLQPSCDRDEQKTAGRGLWTLAFNDVCKGHISVEPRAISSLQWLVANSTDERVRHGARGALWEVSARWRVSTRSHEQDKIVIDTPHIMISYQWDAKPTVLKVKDALQASGYKVWMDVQNMSGSTLEAMALAVERAAAVIVCLSQKYKDSPNCRSEAEYTYRLRKRVVPLLLEQNYSPDGWLGIMIGTRLYFDFSQLEWFEPSLEGLTKELGDMGKVDNVRGRSTASNRNSNDSDPLTPIVSEMMSPGLKSSGMRSPGMRSPGLRSPTPSTSPNIRLDVPPDFVIRQSSNNSTVSVVSNMSSVLSSGSGTPLTQIPFCDLNSWLIDNDLLQKYDLYSSFSIDLLREMKEVQKECPKFLYKCLQNEYGLCLVDILKFSRALRRTCFP